MIAVPTDAHLITDPWSCRISITTETLPSLGDVLNEKTLYAYVSARMSEALDIPGILIPAGVIAVTPADDGFLLAVKPRKETTAPVGLLLNYEDTPVAVAALRDSRPIINPMAHRIGFDAIFGLPAYRAE